MADERNAEATRRQFFRLLGRQTAAGAGNLIGTVNALRESSAAAASELFGPPAEAATARAAGEAPTAADFRSPYRHTAGALLLLDQRALPERVTVIECREPTEVAAAIRAGVVGGGPVLGQLAAHAAALAVGRVRDRTTHERRSALRAAATTLRAARPTQHAIRHALARLEAVDEALPDDVSGERHARALFDEAEAIAMSAALDHGRLARAGADLLAAREPASTTPTALLVHGDGGPLAGGLVGTSLAIVTTLAGAGRPLRVWLTEAAPTLEGSRLAAGHLAGADVPFTIVADTAVSWLLDHRRLDAVLLRADWVCADGDAVCPIGSLNIARLAAAATPAVPVFGCAPVSLVDLGTPSGSSVAPEFRAPVADATGPRLDPAADVVPGALLAGLITDAGVIEPPYPMALDAVARRAAEADG